MELLHILEGIRNPILNYIMYIITQFGDETVFLVIALWVYWCVNKKLGYYILGVGFWGLEINQLLKMIFRVPRPWVLDPDFTIVELARSGAGGYSFPSGHTQVATGVFGALARAGKHKSRIFGILMILLVSFSRMYLGVHTPLDVAVSLIIGTVLVFVLYPFFFSADEKTAGRLYALFLVMLLFSVAVTVYINTLDENIVDAANLEDALKATGIVLGALIAMLVGIFVEARYICFETAAPFRIQLIKYLGGLLLVLAVKSGLKPILALTSLSAGGRDLIRYGMMVLCVIVVWPAFFMKFIVRSGRS